MRASAGAGQRTRDGLALAMALALLCLAPRVAAHPSAVSGILARTAGTGVAVELRLDTTSVLEVLRGTGPGPDAGPIDLARARGRIGRYVQEHFRVLGGPARCPPGEPRRVERVDAIDKVVVELRYECPAAPTLLRLESALFAETTTSHRLLGSLVHEGHAVPIALDRASPVVGIDLGAITAPRTATPAPSPSTPTRGAAPVSAPPDLSTWIRVGLEHILTGADHLLFVLSLVLVATRAGELALLVSAFTAAHSLTLALAALGLVHVPARIVEPLILVTLLWVSLESALRVAPRPRILVTLVFGLVHGLGFASALADLGFDRARALVPLVGFNVGVELGQLLVVLPVFPLVLRARRDPASFLRIRRVAGALIATVAVVWLVGRLRGGT